jgi:UDP-glucose 4-epimerase
MPRALAGARTLITGGAGLIGSHLADLLVAADVAEIVIFDNLSRGRRENLEPALESKRVSVVEGDIRNRELLARHLTGIDVVFHLAAIRLTQCAEDPRLAHEVMADGTFNVIEAAAASKVGRLVAASSASIYGMAERFPTDESHHTWDNRTLYGTAKVYNEGILRAFRDTHGLDYVALRPFNVYGPRMDTKGAYTEVLIRWMERIDGGLPPLIFGDGSQSMDFVYVEDVARGFLLAATADAAGEVFNIASGTETTLQQLADILLSVMGSSLAIEYGPERALTAVPRRLADTRRARERLGFVAKTSVREGLGRLVSWWRGTR